MINKRGMSPIVATVLLIAFAVALGVMVMSIGVQVGQQEDCEGVEITWNSGRNTFNNVCELNGEFYPFVQDTSDDFCRCAKKKLDVRSVTEVCPTIACVEPA